MEKIVALTEYVKANKKKSILIGFAILFAVVFITSPSQII